MRAFLFPLAAVLVLISSSTFAQAPKRLVTKTHPYKTKNLGAKSFITEKQIVGCCLLQGTTLRVETLEGKLVKEEVITTFDSFGINDLKPGNYDVIIVHERYKTPLKLEKVRTGQWISVKLP